MHRQFLFSSLCVVAMLIPTVDCWGRGFGGGGRGGIGGGGGGGGFRGGAGHSPSGFSGGGRSPSGFSGGGRMPSAGGSHNFSGGAARSGTSHNLGSPGSSGNRNLGGLGGTTGRAPGNLGAGNVNRNGGAALGGARPGLGSGGLGQAGAGAGLSGNRGAAPSRNQLNSFLGLPSDGGMHGLSSNPRSNLGQGSFSDKFDVNHGSATGPRGGTVGGATVTGPQGNTIGRAVGAGANGGVGTVGGVRGADGGAAVRGGAVGPGGRAVAGGAVRGPDGGAAARGIAVGPGGAAAGFARVTPSGRYTTGVAVRSNYNHWGVYGSAWHAEYPGAWFAAGWATGAVWRACTWNTTSAYFGYSDSPPIYYDYGNNVTYQDNSVYVNGDEVGTSEEYYDQAATLATAGATADAPADGDWLPLGVFAFCKPDQTSSDMTIQLAVNKEGVLRGNFTDSTSMQNQVIQGSVDKQTQRAAFTVGDNTTVVIETGLYNLTKDEAPCLMHTGKDATEQWLLVRLKNPDAESASAPEAAPN